MTHYVPTAQGPHPILQAGNPHYLESATYRGAIVFQGPNSITLRHDLVNAPHLREHVRVGNAKFTAVVSSPRLGAAHMICGDQEQQQIQLDLHCTSRNPTIYPEIVACRDFDIHWQEGDPVNSIWHDTTSKIQNGDKLAIAERLQEDISDGISLVTLKRAEDNELRYGQMHVRAIEHNGFHFEVKATSGLYDLATANSKDPKRRNDVLVYILAACLGALQKEYSTKDRWDEIDELRRLARKFEEDKLPLWSDDNFEPYAIATALLPFDLSPQANMESDNGE